MNEPDFKSKSVTARITLRCYAGMLQSMEASGNPDLKISDVVRSIMNERFGSVELNEKYRKWVEERELADKNERMNRKKESRSRRGKRFGFIRRMFGK